MRRGARAPARAGAASGLAQLERLAGDAGVDAHLRALRELALEDLHRERVLEHALDHALQRPGAVVRVEALLREQRARLVGHLELDAALLEQPLHALELDIDDAADLVPAERKSVV